MLAQLLLAYQHSSIFILPLLGILWGMVYARYRQESRLVPAFVREAFVVRSVGRPLWRRAYDRWLF